MEELLEVLLGQQHLHLLVLQRVEPVVHDPDSVGGYDQSVTCPHKREDVLELSLCGCRYHHHQPSHLYPPRIVNFLMLVHVMILLLHLHLIWFLDCADR